MNPEQLQSAAHDTAARKQIDRAAAYDGPRYQPTAPRIDPTVAARVPCCAACGKRAIAHVDYLPAPCNCSDGLLHDPHGNPVPCKVTHVKPHVEYRAACSCNAELTARSVREIASCGTAATKTARANGTLADVAAWQAWIDAGCKPHPVFSRATWLAQRRDETSGIIRAVGESDPDYGKRLIGARKCVSDPMLDSRHARDCACTACAEYRVWQASKRSLLAEYPAPCVPYKWQGTSFIVLP